MSDERAFDLERRVAELERTVERLRAVIDAERTIGRLRVHELECVGTVTTTYLDASGTISARQAELHNRLSIQSHPFGHRIVLLVSDDFAEASVVGDNEGDDSTSPAVAMYAGHENVSETGEPRPEARMVVARRRQRRPGRRLNPLFCAGAAR